MRKVLDLHGKPRDLFIDTFIPLEDINVGNVEVVSPCYHKESFYPGLELLESFDTALD